MYAEILYYPPGTGSTTRVREPHDHTDTLATAIAEAAHKAGIYNNEVPLNGPQLLMLLNDMASCVDQGVLLDNTINDIINSPQTPSGNENEPG